jgi:regulator of sirC expression with transglutaminase-like and TPR domain
MQGFLKTRLSPFEQALQAHQRALALDPDSGYAHTQVARIYTQLYRHSETSVQRAHYRTLAEQARQQAIRTAERARAARLVRWMDARLVEAP